MYRGKVFALQEGDMAALGAFFADKVQFLSATRAKGAGRPLRGDETRTNRVRAHTMQDSLTSNTVTPKT